MQTQNAQIDPQKNAMLLHYAKNGKKLLGALARFVVHRYSPGENTTLWEMLTKLYGKDPAQVSAEAFFCPQLEEAFTTLAGPEMAQKVPQLLALRREGQFSISMWRRSYRSSHFSLYAWQSVELLGQLIGLSCYTQSLPELMVSPELSHEGLEYLIALEVRGGNSEVIDLLHEAMLGDNSQVLLTRRMINAVVISGHTQLLEDLLNLLRAARLQEGLRQQILEAADMGSIRVLSQILKVCIDENFFRYSSAIRAFDVWTGLGFGDAKPAAIRQYALTAYTCLTDEAARQACLASGNNTEAYFALWAQGCHEFTDLWKILPQLLEDPQHYRRVLGWLFVSRTDNSQFQMEMASRYLEEQDEELLAWVVYNLGPTLARYWYGQTVTEVQISHTQYTQNSAQRRQLFDRLRATAQRIGSKKRTFTGNPFDFVSVTLESSPVYGCMLGLAACDRDPVLVDALMALAPQMASEQRMLLLRTFANPQSEPTHRQFLHACLGDRSIFVKEEAVKRLGSCTLSSDELDLLAQSLRSKSSDLRAAVLAVFKKQSAAQLGALIPRMLASAEQNQHQAAIELLTELNDPRLTAENRPALEAMRGNKISTQTQILLDQLLPAEAEDTTLTPENGYGLYDPRVVEAFTAGLGTPAPKSGLLSRLFGSGETLLSAKQLRPLLPTQAELDRLLSQLDQVFVRHADDEIEVEDYFGARSRILFGDMDCFFRLPAASGCRDLTDPAARPEMVPFWEEFREALGDYCRDVSKMLGLVYVLDQDDASLLRYSQVSYSSWYLPISQLGLAPRPDKKLQDQYKRFRLLRSLICQLPKAFDPRAVFAQTMLLYRSMISIFGEENLCKPYAEMKDRSNYYVNRLRPQEFGINHHMILTWRRIFRQLELTPEEFAAWFTLEYRLEQPCADGVRLGLDTEAYFRACHEAVIPQDVLTAFLLDPQLCMPVKLKIMTNPAHKDGRRLYERYPVAARLVPQVIDRIVALEETRGELPTAMTGSCLAIERFEGAKHFCNLLAALGREDFFRGYEYSQNTTKKAVLSRLLKRCYPAKEDTAQALAALLKATDISEKRLAEAVMYAPQWADFAEQILDWPGLKCGVWFFHAHINESFSAEKETETAIYSPISPQQFNDGAFDKHWFFEAYDRLGDKRFQILYRSAKYITSGSNQHRRSQLYTDAVLGRLDTAALMQEITEKRNQEKLRCYPLIPIADGDRAEALRRYEFIQKFLKESKQFGAQRRDSEKKACTTALENLAITTGLMDVNRLMWQMESQKLEQLRPLMTPVELEGISLRLAVDENGDAAVALEKAGKPMKTLPKALAKNETYLELKTAAGELKELKRRSRESLERAMTECTLFGAGELQNICGNPVLAPMLHRLVWTDGTHNGFLHLTDRGLGLQTLDGETVFTEPLRIAHPHDLQAAGQWAQFMRLLYEKRLVQPFKQIFREYYPITADERQERTLSRRYAGHQVQPQRTVALLRQRGWTVDYGEGLQKVFYKENLIVRMFALADWFTPAEIEAPTLETVEFFHRRTRKSVPLEEVPPILFSETMRDLDLVVSVAHAGGVDPEASHSTVEMRTALAAELAKLLKLQNVSLVGSHAKIHGALASYSVHLGSGIVHAEGIGMVSILPVHSQARGRIFLPFADDDPKTAEILSKILLLAEDRKLKDPTILAQLRR